jgi:hypothetical protein
MAGRGKLYIQASERKERIRWIHNNTKKEKKEKKKKV